MSLLMLTDDYVKRESSLHDPQAVLPHSTPQQSRCSPHATLCARAAVRVDAWDLMAFTPHRQACP